MNLFFEEILQIEENRYDTGTGYRKMGELLERSVLKHTQGSREGFTAFEGRLLALCLELGCPYPGLALLKHHADEAARGRVPEQEYGHDQMALCLLGEKLTGEDTPECLKKKWPDKPRPAAKEADGQSFAKQIRVTVILWDEQYIYGYDRNAPDAPPLRVAYRQEDGAFDHVTEWLYPGAQMNLLSVHFDMEDGLRTAHPELLVTDPDFLIDITALCQCIQPYGTGALNHLVNKFRPMARSAALQLGNLANQFLDTCVYDQGREDSDLLREEAFQKTLKESFASTPIEYTTLPGIDKGFFDRCRTQFEHIRQTVTRDFARIGVDADRQKVQLEPSFLCEALGLQGRMDLLVSDGSCIVELKSGKAEEYPHLKPKEEHRLQMALYKEILYYNRDVPHHRVKTFLLYSRYPSLTEIGHDRGMLRRAIALRNELVALEQKLRRGEAEEVIARLRPEELAGAEMRASYFYRNYLKQDLEGFLLPLQRMEGLERAYFLEFLTFMEREQFLAKTGDEQPDSGRGFAEVWNRDTQTKRSNGNILTDLVPHPLYDAQQAVTGLELEMPDYGDDFLPNFRNGDAVLLYERNHEGDLATNKQIFKGQIAGMDDRKVTVQLNYKQKNDRVFDLKARYALEPGYSDTSYAQAYRGLYQFLTAPRARRELLLGLRKPEHDPEVELACPPEDEETRNMVRRAMQARDYFLLVGPPGTGKTSVALRAMVRELMAQKPRKQILLMAYTNRAVDEICQMLESLDEQPEYIRIGQELSCEPEYRHRLLKRKIMGARKRTEIFERLDPIQIVTGTISSIAGKTELFELKHFDVAIVDEASQVLEPQLLPLLCARSVRQHQDYRLEPCAIRKFILIGDHKQLPAVVLQQPELSAVTREELKQIGLTNCRNSLFERLHHLQHLMGTGAETVGWLHRQGRMHRTLSDFVNGAFYNGKLDLVPLPHQTGPLEACCRDNGSNTERMLDRRMGFLPVIPAGKSVNPKVNREEAEVTAELVAAYYRRHSGEEGWNPARQIGIIVPFRGQIAMVRKALRERELEDCDRITVDTVERYQGSQRDLIVFCTTVQEKYQMDFLSVPVETDGQWVDRKLNVAITRARKQFFLTGNPELLQQARAYRMLLEYIGNLPD